MIEDSVNSKSILDTKNNDNDYALSSNADDIPLPQSTLSSAQNKSTRQHLSPNSTKASSFLQILQRSPSSTTPPVTKTTQNDVFRSKRGSISFDTETSTINPSSTAITSKVKSSNTPSLLPNCMIKPRLKFSMVRDTANSSLNHNPPVYSMPITRDYSIDEKTNRIVNEFLMYDPSYEENKKNNHDDVSSRVTTKRHHHPHHPRIRAKTFEDTTSPAQNISNSHHNTIQKQISQQSPRSIGNRQRHQSTLQINLRKHDRSQYASVHLADSIEQVEEDDSSDQALPSIVIHSQSNGTSVRRENSIAAASPSIIITGEDSGS